MIHTTCGNVPRVSGNTGCLGIVYVCFQVSTLCHLSVTCYHLSHLSYIFPLPPLFYVLSISPLSLLLCLFVFLLDFVVFFVDFSVFFADFYGVVVLLKVRMGLGVCCLAIKRE